MRQSLIVWSMVGGLALAALPAAGESPTPTATSSLQATEPATGRQTSREPFAAYLVSLGRDIRSLQDGLGPAPDAGPAAVEREIARLRQHLIHAARIAEKRTEEPMWRGKTRALERQLQRFESTLSGGAVATDRALLFEPFVLPQKAGAPINDDCANALRIDEGVFVGTSIGATADGSSTCGTSDEPDVWFRYATTHYHKVFIDTFGSDFDTVLSVHTNGCPGTRESQLTCVDDADGLHSTLGTYISAGEDLLIRVSGFGGDTGALRLRVGPGSSLAGRITDEATGEPLSGVPIEVASPFSSLYGRTDSEGRYQIDGLASGHYAVLAGGEAYLRELYPDLPCPGACGLSAGEPVEVRLGSSVAGIDLALSRGGSLTGRVTDAATGEPITDVSISLVDDAGGQFNLVSTDSNGVYRFDGLSTGSYFLKTYSREFQGEIYDDIPCHASACDSTTGTAIAVVAGSTTASIDFALDRLGAISGRIVGAATGEPIPFQNLEVRGPDGRFLRSGFSDETGHYLIGGIRPGTVYVRTSFSDYRVEVYDDVPCSVGPCDVRLGRPITIELDSTVENVDFELDRLGSVTGRVTDVDGAGIPGVDVYVESLDGVVTRGSRTRVTGAYEVTRVDEGMHVALTRGTLEYLGELHDNVPCPRGVCDRSPGSPFAVALDRATSGIDLSLEPAGGIAGSVRDAITGELLDGWVYLWDESGNYLESAFLDGEGRYQAGGLDTGTYFISTGEIRRPGSPRRYQGQVFDGIGCDGFGCDVTGGTPISVARGSVTAGVDFALDEDLDRCTPSIFRACLNGGRFVTHASWIDSTGAVGPARTLPLTGDTTAFWFFSPDNIELVVKVLDGCASPLGTFWVFAAGLTDVKVALTVEDTWTGELKTYGNGLGEPFEPIQDTTAFATCGYPTPSPVTGPSQDPKPSSNEWFAELEARIASYRSTALPLEPAPRPTPTGRAGECQPDSTTLCLADGRFEVEALWDTGQQAGDARALPLTADTGTFWFFSPDNVELIVKVLDACSLEPFHNFWVFAAGLTDVRVTLRVTDTETGETQAWVNPQGTRFRPIRETGAFRACP